MKTTVRHLLNIVCCLALGLASYACSGGDDEPKDPNKEDNVIPGPDDKVPDPDGTVELSMRNENSGKTYLGDYIYIDKGDNFAGAQFVCVGDVRGLGNITSIPRNGWSDRVKVSPGKGYIAYRDFTFYRIYVTGYILNSQKEVLGADVKYQKGFSGKNEAISLEKSTVEITDPGYASETVYVTNSTIIPLKSRNISADGNAMRVGCGYLFDDGSLSQKVWIEADRNETCNTWTYDFNITALNGRVTPLRVIRHGVVPELGADVAKYQFEWYGGSESLRVRSNAVGSFDCKSSASWLKVTLSETDGKEALYEVRCGINESSQSRSGVLTITQGDVSLAIDVTQSAQPAGTDVSFGPEIYYVGTSQGWIGPYEKNVEKFKDWTLRETSVGSRVYKGQFDVKPNEIFRFYAVLKGWEVGSIGSQIQDWSLPAYMIDGKCTAKIYVTGRGSFELNGWEGGELTFTVDINKGTLEISK